MLDTMERVLLSSRAVISAGYDAEMQSLELEFSSGRIYRFRNVPATVYDWLLRVPNKGVYVTRNITDRYPYEDVTHPSANASADDLEALLEASISTGVERS